VKIFKLLNFLALAFIFHTDFFIWMSFYIFLIIKIDFFSDISEIDFLIY